MSEQADNESICEKLLGWKRFTSEGATIGWGRHPQEHFSMNVSVSTPTFTDRDGGGLILEAFAARDIEVDLLYVPAEKHWEAADGELTIDEPGDTWPLAVRAMALAYIKSLP